MLTEDLVLAILTTALRLRFPFVHSRSFGCRMRVADATAALVPVLNVVPRSICPELTHLTLMLMPWIDSDVAARLGDIWLLDTLHTKLTCPPWNRPVQYTLPKALSEAGAHGHVHVLDWWEMYVGLPYGDDLEGVVDGACANGHVIVVEWWARRGKALDDLCEGSAADLLNVAAVAGHLDVVAALWHLASEQGCLRLLDGHATLARVILADRIHVLEWVLDQVEGSGIGISESEVTGAFMAAAAVGHQQALQVLLDRFGAALFTPAVAALACAGGSVTFVEWCASKVEANATVAISHSPATYYIASACGHVHILDWLRSNKVQVKAFPCAEYLQVGWIGAVMECERSRHLSALLQSVASHDLLSLHPHLCACAAGHVAVVDWWFAIVCERNTTDQYASVMRQRWAHASDVASKHGQVCILDWLHVHPELLVVSPGACYSGLQHATDHGHVACLDWWKEKCELTGTKHVFHNNDSPSLSGISLANVVKRGHHQALVWWFRNWSQQPGATMADLEVPGICAIAVRLIRDSIAQQQHELPVAAEVTHLLGMDSALDNHLPSRVTNRIASQLLGECSAMCQVDVLDWILGHKSLLEHLSYGRGALYMDASAGAMFDTLMWWMQSGLDLGLLQDQVMEWMEWDLAATRNTLFLDACNKVGIVTGPIDLDRVLPKLNIPVLEWAVKYSHMEIKYTETALEDVTLDGRVPVLEWWKKSGLPIKFSAEVLERDYCDDAGVIE